MEVSSFGVDWCTVTNVIPGGNSDRTLWEVFHKKSDINIRWKAGGYKGWQAVSGKLKCGSRARKDGRVDEMLVSSGPSAETIIEEIKPVKQFRITRLDLQVTVTLDTPNSYLASNVYSKIDLLRKAGVSPTGKRKTTLIKSDTGETLYVGKRSSGKKFFRLYDRSFDDGTRQGESWRAEIQYGRDLAQGAAEWYEGEVDNPRRKIDLVCTEFKDGLSYEVIGDYEHWPVDFSQNDASDTSLTSKLDWLKRCVRPTILLLLDHDLEDEARAAVGLGQTWDRKWGEEYNSIDCNNYSQD